MIGYMLIQCTATPDLGKQKQNPIVRFIFACHSRVSPRRTSPRVEVAFQPLAVSQTVEHLHPLSERMKVMNKRPNLFYRAQPHSAISQ